MTGWARLVEVSRRIERAAKDTWVEAQAMRCTAEESGGERCTADAKPEHEHRYWYEDLPDGTR